MTRANAFRLNCLGVFVWLVAAGAVRAETIVFDFGSSLEGWQPKWHKDSTTGTPGMVSHSTERGFLDDASLFFDMGDGFGDDGTLWIDRQFAITGDASTHVSVSFELYSPFQSDFNQFQVKAAISDTEPATQADFTTIGVTETTEGWAPYSFETIVDPSGSTGSVWVGVGVRVAWETHREYWIDRVVVTTAAVPEPASMSMIGSAVVAVMVVGWRRRGSWA